jgi:hypothetical protein
VFPKIQQISYLQSSPQNYEKVEVPITYFANLLFLNLPQKYDVFVTQAVTSTCWRTSVLSQAKDRIKCCMGDIALM